ncbi:hypothetical protein [Microvirga zambiensis]|uniref:hypothetical protein n=1 Tax=Microvirga zambiensis TaxID=1402137 RepID=UPI00191FF185|nr:hypothetical protein [Microvirga zambiensis]
MTIYLTGSGTVLDFKAGANIELTAPTWGSHAGILFFQDRNFGGQHNFAAGVNATLDGALYFPKGTLNISGNTNVSATSNCLMIVADRINIDTTATSDSSSTLTAPNTSLCPLSPTTQRSRVVM